MNDTPTPIWRPISFLTTYNEMIDGTFQEAKEQLQLLEQAKSQPYVLDDATVNRVIRCYSESATYIPLYREQLGRWDRLDLTGQQRREVDRLKTQVDDLSDVLDVILSLADELKENTIDSIFAKDDAELAFDVLTGKTPSPWRDDPNHPLTEEQIRLASTIDEHVQQIIKDGGTDEDLLVSMSDHMDTFKQLLDQSKERDIDLLSVRYPGFYRFAKLLEAIAKGTQDGSVRVP